MPAIDWLKIKNDYITSNISYRNLAEKYDVSFSTLEKTARKEKWYDLRKKQRDKIATKVRQKTVEKIVEVEVDRISNIIKLSDKLSEKIARAIEQVDKILVDGEIVDVGIVDTHRLRQLVQSLKDVKDIVNDDSDKADLKRLDAVLEQIGGNI